MGSIFQDTDKLAGAGGKGSAGYWGVSTDEDKEAAFEARYRQLIPNGLYKSQAHNPLTCKVCTNERKSMYSCPNGGIGFGLLPESKSRVGGYTLSTCDVCGEIRSRRKTMNHANRSDSKTLEWKGLSLGKNPKGEN